MGKEYRTEQECRNILARRKLPYIPDKKMFAAVMRACSWINSNEERGKPVYFNRIVAWCANHYEVDPEELKQYLINASSVGRQQKGARNRLIQIEHEKRMAARPRH